jgi:GT2 family glycosyltransferase
LTAPQATLTVAIATYNGRELLHATLTSLAAENFRDFRVIVVDDASTDGTAAWLRERWPDVELIAHSTNRGVTAALNAGLRASQSEFVCLLNNDIELDPDCLGELMRSLRGDPAAGSACPKLLSFDDRSLLDGAGDTFNWAGTGWRRGHGERDVGQYDREQPIFGACAGAAVYRRTALETVGLLDEDFFAFYEDVDWSFRAQLAGFSCRYVPRAVAYHIGSATLGKGETDFTRYHTWRNGIWIVLKDYPLLLLLLHVPRIAVRQLENLRVASRERKLGLLWRVWRDAVHGLPVLLRKRAAVQRTRRVSLRRLASAVREAR